MYGHLRELMTLTPVAHHLAASGAALHFFNNTGLSQPR